MNSFREPKYVPEPPAVRVSEPEIHRYAREIIGLSSFDAMRRAVEALPEPMRSRVSYLVRQQINMFRGGPFVFSWCPSDPPVKQAIRDEAIRADE